MKKAKISMLDLEELACKITGLDYDEIDGDTSTIEDKLYEEFEIDLEGFQELISRLMPLIDVGTSPLTGQRFKGFSDIENKCWLAKMAIGDAT